MSVGRQCQGCDVAQYSPRMPRPKKTPPTSESAAETSPPGAPPPPKVKEFHPLFPALDMRSISSLWVYRLVCARGQRRAEVPEMLDGPLDPGAITSDAMLRNYGPGVIRLIARSHNGGIIGHPITMRFPDERGHVPVLPEEFGGAGPEQAPAAPADPLRVELELLKQRMTEERQSWKEILKEEREQRRADVLALTALSEKILEAKSAVAAPAPSAEAPAQRGDGWMRQEFQRLSRELEKTNKELQEKKEAFFKLQVKKGDQPEELGLDKMMQIANFMREFMREGAGHGGAVGAAPSPAPAATVPEGFINFAGEVIPGLELLDAAIKSEGGDVAKALSDDGLATFKRLHAKGMLPRSYEQRLLPVLGPVG